MNYDLTIKVDRRRFIKRANYLLRKQRTNISLLDESKRTLEQNKYLHVLCRILAEDSHTSEEYIKEVCFKQLANKGIFSASTKDPITKKPVQYLRSTTELSIPEMSQAISNFILWAAEWGYNLPEASLDDDGNLTFKTDNDREAFHKAQLQTSKFDEFGNIPA